MLKAVNIKGYRFGKNADRYFARGFAILDTETGDFLAYPASGIPYILDTKKVIQSCIDSNFETILTDRIPYTAKLA